MSVIAVLTQQRNTRRQIARALGSGGFDPSFLDSPNDLEAAMASNPPDLLIVDGDTVDRESVATILSLVEQAGRRMPVILLSISENKGPLLELIRSQEIGNLVAKHGAIRAVYPVVDERELLVTCQKVLRRDIFGIEKYVGMWGAEFNRATLTGMVDKTPFLTEFDEYLRRLDVPARIIPDILTVAEELIINAIVHAPTDADGKAKYEEIGPRPDLMLASNEHVSVCYACDGQRLMLSVTDNFGMLAKETVYNYISRGFGDDKMSVEQKAGGAGLGLSMAFVGIHQLIFNIQDRVRTEAIAGWYMRVNNASEFRQVGKSLNLFWLASDSRPISTLSGPAPRPVLHGPRPAPPPASLSTMGPGNTAKLVGRVDENTDLSQAARAAVMDLKEVATFTSRGVLNWLKMVNSLGGRRVEMVGCPEPLVRLAGEVTGLLQGITVTSVMCPYSCLQCGVEQLHEVPTAVVLKPTTLKCKACGGSLEFGGATPSYQAFLEAIGSGS